MDINLGPDCAGVLQQFDLIFRNLAGLVISVYGGIIALRFLRRAIR